MSQEYGAHVGLPLYISVALLALTTAALLAWGGRLTQVEDSGQPPTTRPVGDTFLRLPWPLWGLFVTVVFLMANQLLVRGAAVGTWDADGQFFPYYVLVADHARALRIALWDPWSNGGLPVLGDPQIGVLSPLNVAFGFLTGGTSFGFRSYWLLVWWLGGFGVLTLGRHLGAPAWGAAMVALGFLFCGVYTGNAEHTSWITAFSFLPLTVWRLDVALRSGDLRPAAQAGALWGLSGLAGYPGVIILTGCFAGLWALGRWITRTGVPAGVLPRNEGPTLGFALASIGLVGLAGVLVLSPLYLGFFIEMAGTNPRVGALSRVMALSNALEPGAVATFASPYLTALKAVRQIIVPDSPPGKLWPGTDVAMVNVYAGAIIPSLALFGLLRSWRDGWRWWLAGLAVLSLAAAMGEAFPLRGWLYDWLYPMRFFRHSAIFRLYYLFALTVLALLATRDLAADLRRQAPTGRMRYFLASLMVTLCAGFAAVPLLADAWSAGMPPKAVLLGRLHFVGIWSGVCVVSGLAWRWIDQSRAWRVPVLLLALAAGDTLLTSVLSIPTVLRVGEAAERWQRLDDQHRASLDLTANGWRREPSSCIPDLPTERCRRNDQLITKVPVFNAYATEKNPFHLAMIHHPVLGGMATGTDRVWFATQVVQAGATEGAFEALRLRAETIGAPPLVIHAPDELSRRGGGIVAAGAPAKANDAIGQLPPAERIRADVVRYLPDELVFDVWTATNGWLLVTDRWARGWRAEVNGRQTRVYGGNFIFRAVPVAAGANRVRFVYRPLVWPWLLLVSWGTLATVAVWSAAARRGR